jgi:hypothetical protein
MRQCGSNSRRLGSLLSSEFARNPRISQFTAGGCVGRLRRLIPFLSPSAMLDCMIN